MRGGQAGVIAQLLGLLDFGFGGAGLAAFGDEVLQLEIAFRQFLRQRMIRRQRHKAGAEQRVGPGGEDIQLFAIGQRELEAQAFAAADPVLLHHAGLFPASGPACPARSAVLRQKR